ncbi:hypothetical protein E2C01_100280 [Portunus trituberculatus]|uniref:Uncharacterized protein n=1 Tax=Portunus trituberculatus TaxID=210409 RepID=A0A5B7KCY0_PORTR|nr:hypothetical protein [Portunus trituberculatus]
MKWTKVRANRITRVATWLDFWNGGGLLLPGWTLTLGRPCTKTV